jgi:endonuclease-8
VSSQLFFSKLTSFLLNTRSIFAHSGYTPDMEGPSLVIITEELAEYKGKVVKDLIGNTKIDKDKMCGKKIKKILSWGKHLIFEFDTFFIRVHFLMYGSYRVNEKKDSPIRLSMVFDTGEVNFYNCSIKIIEGISVEEAYDWRTDIMSNKWDKKEVIKRMKLCENEKVADILMDQSIFTGVGNIIKNEVLFNQKIQPDSRIEGLSNIQISSLADEARSYSKNFYKWKKEFSLKKHWQIMRKSVCPRDGTKVTKKKTGKGQRWSFFCTKCQILYE